MTVPNGPFSRSSMRTIISEGFIVCEALIDNLSSSVQMVVHIIAVALQ